jgi:hypothetical protein
VSHLAVDHLDTLPDGALSQAETRLLTAEIRRLRERNQTWFERCREFRRRDALEREAEIVLLLKIEEAARRFVNRTAYRIDGHVTIARVANDELRELMALLSQREGSA